MKKIVRQSILSGILVGIGVIVNTVVENRYVGSMLFSLALLTIISCDLKLYTGKIGFIKQVPVKNLIVMFFGNIFGVFIAVFSFGLYKPDVMDKLMLVSKLKFDADFFAIFCFGVFCGILMFIAVYCKNQLITVFCIMVFILSGFEHCIADFPYLIVNLSVINIVKFLCVVCGNSVGSIFTHYLMSEDV